VLIILVVFGMEPHLDLYTSINSSKQSYAEFNIMKMELVSFSCVHCVGGGI